MKLQVTQENLSRALSSVSRIANIRNTLPILSNVLIRTENKRLSISATNLDIAIIHHIGAKIEKDGGITVPAKLMQEFIGSLPSSVIDLNLEGTKLTITTEKYNSTINGIVADDFPVMPSVSKDNMFSINSDKLKKALNQVVFSAGIDDSRQVLTGVYFYTNNQELVIVATDGYRLSEKKLGKMKDFIPVLVPSSASQDLIRIISEAGTEVNIFCDEQQAMFQAGDIELTTRLLEGKYPDYASLIPKEFENSATLNRNDFIEIVKVASLFAKESAYSVTISLDSANNSVNVKSIATQVGENVSSADAVVTNDAKITLNSKFLLDALNVFDGNKIFFGFNKNMEPSVLKDPDDDSYVHVVMPLKS